MWKRFKNWLYAKYLPARAKETVWAENKKLKERLFEMERQRDTDVARAYAEGMAYALRHAKVNIRNEVK